MEGKNDIRATALIAELNAEFFKENAELRDLPYICWLSQELFDELDSMKKRNGGE